MKKAEDFSEWYNEIVERANLTDKRYPIKGMNVWTPYGWKIMQAIDADIRKGFDATGHQEVCFPLLIPEDQFAKEKEHIKGFDAEVFWVTHAGLNKLDVRLLLRPTSETAMYPMFSLWVRSHADLPLKTYQIVNTFRYETKQTRAFIRVREIHFFESHTCHADFEDAERQVNEDYDILAKLAKRWCIPYKLLKRTDWDKFPGAFYTVGVDTLLPSGRSLQLGSIHQYKENFSKPYEIKYEDDKGEHHYVHQTTFGMSERLVGAVVAIHGDDKGIVLPPDIATMQVVIVPVLAKGETEKVSAAAKTLHAELQAAGIKAHLDDRDVRPGAKYFDWELKGVPLRLELGKRDIDQGKVTFVRRDTFEKSKAELKDLPAATKTLFEAIQANLAERSRKVLEDRLTTATSIDELRVFMEQKRFVRINWCGDINCAERLKEQVSGEIRGTLWDHKEEPTGPCLVCGDPAKNVAYVSRTY